MKRLLTTGFALALLVPVCALAQSMFNGTWKLDPTTLHSFGGEAVVITLEDGMFSRSADPAFKVKADGRDHPVSGHKNFDSVAFEVIDDHTVRETDKKDGKVVSVVNVKVAPDGKTATLKVDMYGKKEHMTATELLERVGHATPGTNAATGSWRLARIIDASGNDFAVTYRIDGTTVTASESSGGGYTAQLGGKPVPSMSDEGKPHGMVSVAMLGENTLRETYTRDGKVHTNTMTISADGNTMLMVGHDMDDGRTTTMLHYKQ